MDWSRRYYDDYENVCIQCLLVFSQEQSETVFSVIIELASLPDEIWTGEVVPLGRLPDFAGILLDFGTNSGAEFG